MKRQQYSNLRNHQEEATLINKSSLEARKIKKNGAHFSQKSSQVNKGDKQNEKVGPEVDIMYYM